MAARRSKKKGAKSAGAEKASKGGGSAEKISKDNHEFVSEAEEILAERLGRALPPEKFWPVATQAFEIAPDGVSSSALSRSSESFLNELDGQLFTESAEGLIVPKQGPEIGAFRRLDDGTILIARIAQSDIQNGAAALAGSVFGVAIVMGLVSVLMGTMVSREFARSLEELRQTAGRLAGGDLARNSFDPTDDEFGELAQSLSAIGDRFRGILDRTTQSVAKVEESVAGLTVSLGGIVGASRDQSEQVAQANVLMSAIQGQVGEASRFAGEFNHTIDQSSDSVGELSAAGDELNETASVLTSRVDAVSDSLEQMVASVKQVGSTTERLAEASEETSSSMEEMASAMRAVDSAAESTANLAWDVVEKAELGRAKVLQTIEGMEAIREATDAAERVIRGLGTRTDEIGGILDVIEDVADETNLLALNAAIIAAQAGDQGRAFSVIAYEIKELADRVLASTKEIGGLMERVRDSADQIGVAGSEQERGNEVVYRSALTMREVVQQVRRTTEDQTAGLGQIRDNVVGVRGTVEQITGVLREQSDACSQVTG